MECTSSDGTKVAKKDCVLDVNSAGLRTENCGTFPCEPVLLQTGSWSECSCSTQTQTRKVKCVSQKNKNVSMDRCLVQVDEIPAEERACQNTNCSLFTDPADRESIIVADTATRRLLQTEDITNAEPCFGRTCSGKFST